MNDNPKTVDNTIEFIGKLFDLFLDLPVEMQCDVIAHLQSGHSSHINEKMFNATLVESLQRLQEAQSDIENLRQDQMSGLPDIEAIQKRQLEIIDGLNLWRKDDAG